MELAEQDHRAEEGRGDRRAADSQIEGLRELPQPDFERVRDPRGAPPDRLLGERNPDLDRPFGEQEPFGDRGRQHPAGERLRVRGDLVGEEEGSERAEVPQGPHPGLREARRGFEGAVVEPPAAEQPGDAGGVVVLRR